jgi:hypothetical protein
MCCRSVGCGTPSRTPVGNAIDNAQFSSGSHRAVIRVYGETGNVIETHKHAGDFKEW